MQLFKKVDLQKEGYFIAMADDGTKEAGEGDKVILHTYPLVKVCLLISVYVYICCVIQNNCFFSSHIYIQHSDMTEEMKMECIDFSITACEKHATNYEVR